jgi:hypothetical protein
MAVNPATLAMLGSAVEGGSKVASGVIDQIGSGIREWRQNAYTLEQMDKQGQLTRDELKLKEELTEKQAQKLLDLELKQMELESKIYKDKSGVDIDKYRQLALLEQDAEKLKTEDELKLIQAKFGGQTDLMKMQLNLQGMNSYQPTRITDYSMYSTMGASAPLSTPLPQFSYSQPYVPFRKVPSYRVGLTGHKILNE